MFKYMYQYLQQKPQVGIISGLGTGFMMKVQTLLTDDYILKLVSGVAVWAGSIVAVLTVVVWVIKLYDMIKVRLKTKK